MKLIVGGCGYRFHGVEYRVGLEGSGGSRELGWWISVGTGKLRRIWEGEGITSASNGRDGNESRL